MSLRACTDSGFTWANAPGMASSVASTPSIRFLRIIVVSLGLEVDRLPLRASHGSLEHAVEQALGGRTAVLAGVVRDDRRELVDHVGTHPQLGKRRAEH